MTDPLTRSPDKVIMYNEPYVVVAAGKHPNMMGRTFEYAWPEVSNDFVFAAELTRQATMAENTRFLIERHEYLEEYGDSLYQCTCHHSDSI